MFGLTRHPVYGGLVVVRGMSMILNPRHRRRVLLAVRCSRSKLRRGGRSRTSGRDHAVENAPRLVPDVGKPQKVLDVIKLSLTEASAADAIHGRRKDVLNQARSAPLVVFITDNSRPCKRALDLLRENAPTSNLPEPVVVNLDELEKSESTLKRAALGRITGTPTVPFVWIGGRYVGSFDEGPNAEAPGLVKLSFQGRLNLGSSGGRHDVACGPGGCRPTAWEYPRIVRGCPMAGNAPNGQGHSNGEECRPATSSNRARTAAWTATGFGQQGKSAVGQRPGQGQFGQGQFGQGQLGQGQFGRANLGRVGWAGQFGQGQFGRGQFGQDQQQQQRPGCT